MEINKRFELICRNLQEVLNTDRLRELLSKDGYRPKIYWGTAPTGRIHIGYLCPMLKIADLVEAECDVIILVADLHAYLDSMKSTLAELEARTEYYILMVKQLLTLLNVSLDHISFVKGTSFQLSKEYTMDVYKANSMVTYGEARHAGADVVRQNSNPVMNSLLYPSLQTIDMHYLNADAFLGGIDQRKINVMGLTLLPKLGYTKGIYLMNPMIPGLSLISIKNEQENSKDGKKINKINKMSASVSAGKIDLLDNPTIIAKTIKPVYCKPGDVEDNTVMILCKHILFPILDRTKKDFVIKRQQKYGGDITIKTYQEIEALYKTNNLHPMDFKVAVSDAISEILKPIRDKFTEKDISNILQRAYSNH